jgi:hypothetical protein
MLGKWVRITNPNPVIGMQLAKVTKRLNGGKLGLCIPNARGLLVIEPHHVGFVSRYTCPVAFTRTHKATERVIQWLETQGQDVAYHYNRNHFEVLANETKQQEVLRLLHGFWVDPETGHVLPKSPAGTAPWGRMRRRVA